MVQFKDIMKKIKPDQPILTQVIEDEDLLVSKINTFCNGVADSAMEDFGITDEESKLVYRNLKAALTFLTNI